MSFKNGLRLTDKMNNTIGWGNALEMYAILSMLEQSKDEILILNFFGISRHEYDEILSNARENQLLDQTNNLTEKARMALSEINAVNYKPKDIDVTKLNTKVYLPHAQ